MTPESRFKQRTNRSAERVAEASGLPCEYGAKAGDPDKVYKFGHVWVGCEHKRKGAKPRKLQSHRMTKLEALGLPCMALAAQEDQFADEKQTFYRELLEAVSEERVKNYLLIYERQAEKLRDTLEGMIDE